jgi:hypothetical protein
MTAADDSAPPLHGPYDDRTTAGQAERAAEVIRYLNYATARDGVTEPATVASLTGHLAEAAARLPQLLTQLTDWLHREISAGRVASDRPQPTGQLASATREQLRDAAEQARYLARALDHAHQLTSTLHGQAEDSPAPPRRNTHC